MSNCCPTRIVNLTAGGGGGGGPYTVDTTTTPGSAIVTDTSSGNAFTLVLGAGTVDFSTLTAVECDAILSCLDFNNLTPGQVTDILSELDFSQLTPAQIADLKTVLGPLFTVNAGTTGNSADAVNGSEVVTFGDILHFWSNNDTISFNVSAGSAVVEAHINPTALAGIAHTAITGIDLKPTGTANEYVVEIAWVDGSGVAQTTVDPTPITITPPALSTDIGQTLVASSGDGEFYAMPVTDIACYEAPGAVVSAPYDYSNNGAGTATGVSGNVTLTYATFTPSVDVDVSTIGIVLSFIFGGASPIGNLEIRTGNGRTMPLFATSTNTPAAVNGFAGNTGLTTDYTFAPGTILTAGQVYSLVLPGGTIIHNYATYPSVDPGSAFYQNNGTLASNDDLGIHITGTTVGAGVATQYDVITYSDGVATKVVASEVGNATDIQDVTAGLPVGWVECPVATSDNIYTADGTLTGERTVNMGGHDITWEGGGDFIIDGKLTVTGLIDPTGVQFTDNVNQPDASMPNTTIFVTDGSLSGIPAGEIVFKDGAGNYHALESSVSDSIYNADGNLEGPRVVSGANPAFPGFNSSLDFESLSKFGVQTLGAPGVDSNLDLGPNGGFSLDSKVGTAEGSIVFDNATGDISIKAIDTGAGSTNEIVVGGDGIELEFGLPADLKIDGVAGTLGQVLQSNGANVPPQWVTLPVGTTDTFGTVAVSTAPFTSTNGVAVGTSENYVLFPDGSTWAVDPDAGQNITSADLTADANHTQDFAGFSQDWNNLSNLDVSATGSVDFDADSASIGTATGQNFVDGGGDDFVSLNLDVADFQAQLDANSDGTGHRAKLDLDADAVGDGISLTYNSPGQERSVVLDSDGIDLNFDTADDLKIDGDAGLNAQVLQSNGPGVAPTWVTLPVGTSDTFGTVAVSAAPFTSTNGVAVGASENYVLFPDGSSWAAEDGGQNITNASLVADNNYTQDFANYNQTWTELNNFSLETVAAGASGTRIDLTHHHSGGTESSHLELHNNGFALESSHFNRNSRVFSVPLQVGFDYDGVNAVKIERVGATNQIQLVSRAVTDAIATAGEVWTLIDSATGYGEWSALPAGSTDTFGTVTPAALPLTTTNGVDVAAGELHILFPDSSSWANEVDTSGTVAVSAAPLTSTNGVAVGTTENYILFPDGSTWATEAVPVAYRHAFVTGDFAANLGDMDLFIPQSVHGLPAESAYSISIYQSVAGTSQMVTVDSVSIGANGDVGIRVPAGDEFDGFISIA